MPLPFIHISLLRQVWMPHSCICWMRLPRPWRFFPPPSSSHDLNPARKGFLYGTHALIRCSETHASCLPHRQTLEKKKKTTKENPRQKSCHTQQWAKIPVLEIRSWGQALLGDSVPACWAMLKTLLEHGAGTNICNVMHEDSWAGADTAPAEGQVANKLFVCPKTPLLSNTVFMFSAARLSLV